MIARNHRRLYRAEKEKVLIHELLHIPKGFSGGFKPHKGNINKKTIDNLHKTLTSVATN
jgi:predicted metallopeptidase